jgi:hypothetical protein
LWHIAADVLAAFNVRYGVGASAATYLGASGIGATSPFARAPAKDRSPPILAFAHSRRERQLSSDLEIRRPAAPDRRKWIRIRTSRDGSFY